MTSDPPVPCPTEEQHEGFLIVRTRAAMAPWTQADVARWSSDPGRYWDHLRGWHVALGLQDGAGYAGVDRTVLGRWTEFPLEEREELRRQLMATGMSSEDLQFLVELPLDDLPDARAMRLLTAKLGPDPELYWDLRDHDVDLLPKHALAAEILAACDVPTDREIVRVIRRPTSCSTAELGFDVCQWGRSHVSVLKDCFVLPSWHPPPEEALPDLRLHSAGLNENLLFERVEAAQAFAAWYRAQAWGETACYPDEYQVIGVAPA